MKYNDPEEAVMQIPEEMTKINNKGLMTFGSPMQCNNKIEDSSLVNLIDSGNNE